MQRASFRSVAGDYFVAPQLQAADFAAAKDAGIRTIINNRPDGEVADQLSDAEARELAASHGLDYAYVPVVSGRMGRAGVGGRDRRASRPLSRLLPVGNAVLSALGVRDFRATARGGDLGRRRCGGVRSCADAGPAGATG